MPPTTCSPPNFLTPRRRPAESRPFRDEPPAFLWAMTPSSGMAPCGRRATSLRSYTTIRAKGESGSGRRPRRRAGRRLGPSGQEFRDADGGQVLLVAPLAARILAPALLESDDLRAATV